MVDTQSDGSGRARRPPRVSENERPLPATETAPASADAYKTAPCSGDAYKTAPCVETLAQRDPPTRTFVLNPGKLGSVVEDGGRRTSG